MKTCRTFGRFFYGICMEKKFLSPFLQAYKVRTCIPLQGEGAATGAALGAPLLRMDNALILVHRGGEKDGCIHSIQAYSPKHLPAGLCAKDVHDLGEGTLVPAAINAHTHTQLAHLAGRTTWHEGFVPWLKSLISLLSLPYDAQKITQAVQTMQRTGTGYFADYGHTGLAMVAQSAQDAGLEGIFLAEWLGFEEEFVAMPWQTQEALPTRVRASFTHMSTEAQAHCIPCGHALYSTAPQVLQGAHAWCSAQAWPHKRPFALHLAEFPEEVQALSHGEGALVELFRGMVLPQEWQAPGMHPVDYAGALGLLTENTLAVHGVHCEAKHRQRMQEAGLWLCLCPRSNAYLRVGTAPVEHYVREGMRLCLGTDGLSSNTDVDVWQEAVYLQEHFQLPAQALLRMLTVNGAHALGVQNQYKNSTGFGTLEAGKKALWTFLPDVLQN